MASQGWWKQSGAPQLSWLTTRFWQERVCTDKMTLSWMISDGFASHKPACKEHHLLVDLDQKKRKYPRAFEGHYPIYLKLISKSNQIPEAQRQHEWPMASLRPTAYFFGMSHPALPTGLRHWQSRSHRRVSSSWWWASDAATSKTSASLGFKCFTIWSSNMGNLNNSESKWRILAGLQNHPTNPGFSIAIR